MKTALNFLLYFKKVCQTSEKKKNRTCRKGSGIRSNSCGANSDNCELRIRLFDEWPTSPWQQHINRMSFVSLNSRIGPRWVWVSTRGSRILKGRRRSTIQLYEMIVVRHGLMLVGRPFSGKTASLKVNITALPDRHPLPA